VDDFQNLTVFTADNSGSYTYTQDFLEQHFLFIQTVSGTKFLVDNATGGDCTSIGTWNSASKTCALTTDVYQTIQINSPGITLDGNGHTLNGNPAGDGFLYAAGVYSYGKSNILVKTLTIQRFFSDVMLLFNATQGDSGGLRLPCPVQELERPVDYLRHSDPL